jgi:hypothetical protein
MWINLGATIVQELVVLALVILAHLFNPDVFNKFFIAVNWQFLLKFCCGG